MRILGSGRARTATVALAAVILAGFPSVASAHYVSNYRYRPDVTQSYDTKCWSQEAAIDDAYGYNKIRSWQPSPYTNGGCGLSQAKIALNVASGGMKGNVTFQTYYGAVQCSWTSIRSNSTSTNQLTIKAAATPGGCGPATYLTNNYGYYGPRGETMYTLSPNHWEP